jgi:hypothetical protein
MLEFSYSKISRLIYRWINIPASVLLIIYILFSFAMLFEKPIYILPLLINLIVLVVINKFFFMSYKYFPFNIKADNEKIICTDFLDKAKIITIYHKDISEIKGGIFSGNLSRPIYLIDSKNNKKIGFHAHLKDSNKLLTIILSNIEKSLYDTLLQKMQIQKEDFHSKLKNKNKKKKN